MLILARLRLPVLGQLLPLGSRTVWTLVGGLAVPLWATWPLMAALTASTMPLFQYLALIFLSGAVTLWLMPGARSFGQAPWFGPARQSRGLAALMVALGLLVSTVLFIRAIAEISVAQANLIMYLWPIIVVALCVPLGLAKLRRGQVVGMALGLVGAVLVIGTGDTAPSLTGMALAASAGLAWAVSVVFRVWQGEGAPDALAPGMALSGVLATGLHLVFEQTTIPSASVLAGAVLIGIVPSALGNLAWDHGVRKGDKVLLATLAYATPLVAALLLVVAGFATATPGLVIGAVLIVAAGAVTTR